jgi:hypothetical protein
LSDAEKKKKNMESALPVNSKKKAKEAVRIIADQKTNENTS